MSFDAYYPAPLDGWYELRAWPTPDGLSVYFIEVTERKRARDRAERSAQRLALLAQVSAELAGTLDAELGGAGWTPDVFTVAFLAMSLSGGLWMLSTLILTPLLKRGDVKLRSVNPALMAIVPSAALLAAFASLGIAELPKSSVHILTVVVSAIVMAVCLLLARALRAPWLREWGLGFSIIIGLVVAYFAHGAGMGATA